MRYTLAALALMLLMPWPAHAQHAIWGNNFADTIHLTDPILGPAPIILTWGTNTWTGTDASGKATYTLSTDTDGKPVIAVALSTPNVSYPQAFRVTSAPGGASITLGGACLPMSGPLLTLYGWTGSGAAPHPVIKITP